MTPKFNSTVEKIPYKEGEFLLRALNESTGCSLSILPQPTFRPVMTVYHPDSIQTNRVAMELARYVEGMDEECWDEMTTESVIALMATMLCIKKKAPLINMALKWILKNPLEPPILNALLQSIVVSNIPYDKVAVIRLAIHKYLHNPELKDHFDISVNVNGFVNLKRKKHSDGGSNLWAEADKISFDRIHASIATKYDNPFFKKKKNLTWRFPENRLVAPKKEKNSRKKLFEKIMAEKQLADPNFHLEFQRLKDKEEEKPVQLGYASHPYFKQQLEPGFVPTFGMPKPPPADLEDRKNHLKELEQKREEWLKNSKHLQDNVGGTAKTNQPRQKFTWNNNNKPYRRWMMAPVRPIGFPKMSDSDTDSEDIPVEVRDLNTKKYLREKKRNATPSPQKTLFKFVESDGESSDDSEKVTKQLQTVTIDECRSSSGFGSQSSSRSSISSSENSKNMSFTSPTTYEVKVNDRSVAPSSQNQRPLKRPHEIDQLMDHLNDLMIN